MTSQLRPWAGLSPFGESSSSGTSSGLAMVSLQSAEEVGVAVWMSGCVGVGEGVSGVVDLYWCLSE